MAMLFAVKRVAEYCTGKELPRGAIYLDCQRSIFFAAALADRYGEQIRATWTKEGFNLSDLAALDYTDFVRVSPDC